MDNQNIWEEWYIEKFNRDPNNVETFQGERIAFLNACDIKDRQISKKDEMIKLMEVALEFYADKGSWGEVWVSTGKDENGDDLEGDVGCQIDLEDVDIDDNDYLTFAGKLARQTLAKLNELKKEQV